MLRHSAKGLLSRNDEGEDSSMRLGVFRLDSSPMSIDDVLADIETGLLHNRPASTSPSENRPKSF